LENIFSKPLVKAPKRIQRMLMQLQNYNVTVSYVKGKSLHLADAHIKDQPHPDEKSIEILIVTCPNVDEVDFLEHCPFIYDIYFWKQMSF
jgi:hypothetical protein